MTQKMSRSVRKIYKNNSFITSVKYFLFEYIHIKNIKYIFSAEPFVDVYENQSLTVEQLRQLTWQELESFVPPDPNEVGEF